MVVGTKLGSKYFCEELQEMLEGVEIDYHLKTLPSGETMICRIDNVVRV